MDEQFVDDYLAALYEERQGDTRRHWVEDKLAADFIENAWITWYATWVALGLTCALLASFVNPWLLSTWGVVATGFQAHRWWLLQRFKKLREHKLAKQLLMDGVSFFKRHLWSWGAHALVLAVPAFVYLEQTPAAIQLLCLTILIVVVATAAVHMAARQDCLLVFTLGVLLTVGLAAIKTFVYDRSHLPLPQTLAFAALFALFGWLILKMGRSVYSSQRSGYEASFDNEQLIASLKQQTQNALAAVQLKNNLLASATHDLAQPLHALSFYADMLRNDPEAVQDMLPQILKASDSVNTLFFSLFDFAKIESGAVQIKQERIEVQRLLGDIAAQFEPKARAKGLNLRVHLPKQAPVVLSDSVHLRRIVSNLVSNAVRYTERGAVLVAARYQGSIQRRYLCVEVWDTGVGISAEDLPHVFEDFYRAPGHEGTADSFGLGLAIVKKLCRALAIEISMDSIKGRGTRCRLRFPLK